MAKINTDYTKLRSSYLFSTIAKKVNEYSAANPDANIIRLGIGDVTRPLTPTIIKSLHDAVDEMANKDIFSFDQILSRISFSSEGAVLSLLSDLFGICDACY